MITYKARLVAKGYRQKKGIDYDETFSLVAILKSIIILLAITTHCDYEIWKIDVKTTFLNGNLIEEVYMTQPEGFISENGSKVCKLQRSIYGLCHDLDPRLGERRGRETILGTLYFLLQTLVSLSLITKSQYHIQNKTTIVVVFTVSIHTVLSPIYIYIYKNRTFTFT